jgi:hypothetical protein
MDTILISGLSAISVVIITSKIIPLRLLFQLKLDIVIDIAITIGLPLVFNQSTQAVFYGVLTGLWVTLLFVILRVAHPAPPKSHKHLMSKTNISNYNKILKPIK